MTIQEGKRAIAQALSDHQVKARGLGRPHLNLPAQQPFWFNPPRSSPSKDASGDGSSDYLSSTRQPSRDQECTGIGETKGLNHLISLHLPQTMSLRATGVCYQ